MTELQMKLVSWEMPYESFDLYRVVKFYVKTNRFKISVNFRKSRLGQYSSDLDFKILTKLVLNGLASNSEVT